jgi:hypothetical protein
MSDLPIISAARPVAVPPPAEGLKPLKRPPAPPALQPLGRDDLALGPAKAPGPVRQAVVRDGDRFEIDDKPFRFAGMNAYDLAATAGRSQADLEKELRTIAASGATVVRFWAFARYPAADIQRVLDTSQKLGLGLRFIPVLGDQWDWIDTGSDKKFKDKDWYTNGYKENYLPHLQETVKALGNRPEVLLWEIINEPIVKPWEFDTFRAFATTAAREVKANGGRMTAIGSFGGLQAGLLPHQYRKLAEMPEIDAVSMHDYARTWHSEGWSKGLTEGILTWFGDKELAMNARTAEKAGKPFYIGEVGTKVRHAGWKVAPDMPQVRTPAEAMAGNLSRGRLAFAKGAAGVLFWGPQPDGRSMDGHGFGFDFTSGDINGAAVRGVMQRLNAEANAR